MSSRSFRNKNPGNIRWGRFAESRGAVAEGPENNRMAKWPTVIQGLAAMVSLLSVKAYRDLSLLDAIKRYAPSGDNNRPREYAAYVAQRAGVSQEAIIGEMDPFQLLRVIEAMIRFEGWSQ